MYKKQISLMITKSHNPKRNKYFGFIHRFIFWPFLLLCVSCSSSDKNVQWPPDYIVLDLRGSVWKEKHNSRGCRVTLRFSESRFSGERPTNYYSCEMDPWDESFSEAEAGEGFMFICGGDAQCTYQEINRRESLTADDPRNGCKYGNGNRRPITRQITHKPGSNYFEYTHCPNNDGYRGKYLRQ